MLKMVPIMKLYKLLVACLCLIAGVQAQPTLLTLPTAAASVDIGPPASAGRNWNNPLNVLTLAAPRSVAQIFTVDGQRTDRLYATGFGFAIPATATILGIEAQVVRSVNVNAPEISNVTDIEVLLLKAGVPQFAFNQANTVGTWPLRADESSGIYGNPTDLWANTWTPADINDPGFGLCFAAQRIAVPGAIDQSASVNSIRLRIFYSLPLPIVLKSFDVRKLNGNNSLISWVTEQEVNVKEYEVEHSSNGSNFTTLGKVVPPSPNSSTEQKYSIQDKQPFPGKNYYRLKQTDLDGKFEIFSIKSISFDSKEEYFKVNQPSSNRIRISSVNKKGAYSVQIRDTQGRLIQQQMLLLEGSVNDTYINLNQTIKGIVFVTLSSEEDKQSFKLLLQ
jgi:hypothetical protein